MSTDKTTAARSFTAAFLAEHRGSSRSAASGTGSNYTAKIDGLCAKIAHANDGEPITVNESTIKGWRRGTTRVEVKSVFDTLTRTLASDAESVALGRPASDRRCARSFVLSVTEGWTSTGKGGSFVITPLNADDGAVALATFAKGGKGALVRMLEDENTADTLYAAVMALDQDTFERLAASVALSDTHADYLGELGRMRAEDAEKSDAKSDAK